MTDFQKRVESVVNTAKFVTADDLHPNAAFFLLMTATAACAVALNVSGSSFRRMMSSAHRNMLTQKKKELN